MAAHSDSHTEEIRESGDRLRMRLSQGMLLADGAMGTMLRTRGLRPSEPPELWNLTHPEAVQGIHEAYLAAGCDIIQTNTFGANRLRLMANGLAEQMAAINTAAVQLAREARGGERFVAGTIGPTGCFHGGTHTAASGDILFAFEEQMSALVRAAVDLLLVETMTHLAEARMALQAAEAWPDVPVAVSMVFFKESGGFHTVDGATPQEAVNELRAAELVGCNCMDVENVAEILGQMREVTARPLIAQPNAGVPQRRDEEWVYMQDPEGITRHLPGLLASKPAILGGCCGTTPAHLSAIRRSLR